MDSCVLLFSRAMVSLALFLAAFRIYDCLMRVELHLAALALVARKVVCVGTLHVRRARRTLIVLKTTLSVGRVSAPAQMPSASGEWCLDVSVCIPSG